MSYHRHVVGPFLTCLMLARLVTPSHAQINSWTSPTSGDWDNAANWSAGLPDLSQLEIRITNASSKAVAIQPGTPVNFPGSMTVQNLRVGGIPPGTNVLLLNYSGTATPLRVLHDFNIETNGRVLMLYSSLNVSNALNMQGLFDQLGGELVFTNSPATFMQIEGGRFNMTNGLVNGANLFLGGASDGYVNQDGGLVSLAWLEPGDKPSVPGSTGAGTYVLQRGWLIVSGVELIGENGFGTLAQNGGTNSSPQIQVGNGMYVKTAGGLFAGEITVTAPLLPIYAPPSAIMTHTGGTAMITNDLRVLGQGNRHNPHMATFNMFGGSFSASRIRLEEAGYFNQTNGTVNVADDLFIDDHGGTLASAYSLSGGNLFTSRTIISSSWPESSTFTQSGGAHVVSGTIWINGTAIYQLTGGTVTAPNINLGGSLNYPPKLIVSGAQPLGITNELISLAGGVIVIENSTQQLGGLLLTSDSIINLAGGSAILSFADSQTNSWTSELTWLVPHLTVLGWNGSTNGGGADRLFFGASNSSLTPRQLSQIRFVDPAGFASGTYPSSILSNGEVIPMALPVLHLENSGTNLVLSWTGSFILQSATNVAGPFVDTTNLSPFSVNVFEFPMEYFRLRN